MKIGAAQIRLMYVFGGHTAQRSATSVPVQDLRVMLPSVKVGHFHVCDAFRASHSPPCC